MVLVVCGVPVALLVRVVAGRSWLLGVLLLAITVCMTWTEQVAVGARGVMRQRNFYGIYKVYDRDGQRILQHGTTLHGRQYLDETRAGTPLAYFHPSTPAARVLTSEAFTLQRVGMVGLGTGALVMYGKPGCEFTVFELDQDNIPIAERQFSYLQRAREEGVLVDCVVGDARLALRGVSDGAFDKFIVDAFSSGSIPVHLITLEAFVEYLRVMTPSGILLLHISNRVLDLHPVVYSAAQALGVDAFELTNAGAADPDANDTFWMAVTTDDGVVSELTESLGWAKREMPSQGWPRPWTDQYANLIGAMVWK
jgi:SAM-dependent methyltransferase